MLGPLNSLQKNTSGFRLGYPVTDWPEGYSPGMGCKTLHFFSPKGLPRDLAKLLARATQPGLLDHKLGGVAAYMAKTFPGL